MKKITIWVSRSKTRPYNLVAGERIALDIRKNKKFRKLYIKRQFYSYPEWNDTEVISFSIGRSALEKIIKTLESMGDDLP